MAEEIKKTVKRRKRRTTKKKSVVDSAARNAAVLSDGCNPEFVKGAEFDGIFEMPIIKKPKKIIIPNKLVPFSKMDKVVFCKPLLAKVAKHFWRMLHSQNGESCNGLISRFAG